MVTLCKSETCPNCAEYLTDINKTERRRRDRSRIVLKSADSRTKIPHATDLRHLDKRVSIPSYFLHCNLNIVYHDNCEKRKIVIYITTIINPALKKNIFL